MEKAIILDIFNPGSIFERKIIYNEYDLVLTSGIPAKRKCIRKFINNLSKEKVIIKKQSENHPLLQNKIKLYSHICIETVMPVIEPVCKSVAELRRMELPLDEIIIVAPEETAYSIIYPLINICRMFTIVSDAHNIKKADEIYFKYGCIIRNKLRLTEVDEKEGIIICADERINLNSINLPVINLTSLSYEKSNIINIRDICIYDKQISEVLNLWGGTPGIEFYTLLGLVPEAEIRININIKSDKIFLLDISKV